MYISNLKIHGFKSFAKKDTLTFGEGITAIVGPNGCGKTNIVDAIRWVLGEQKHSVLRSSKMEDVIFNGADSMKPLNVCEVSLTVHNNKGKLPVEYNDVEIGRRIFRNGDSEYFINKTPCRLKDIQNLFIDTGMGADAYSVIELKMIEHILSERNDDRKRMFEEAAGINKYKHQRKSAFRKFDAVRTDLDRVQDIIVEVDAKVKALALQLKRFERHEKLTEELKQREIALAFIKIKEYEEAVAPLRKKIQDFKHLRESTATESSIHEKELEQLKSVYKEQQAELDEMRSEISQAEENRDSLQRKVLVSTEQRRSAESTIERLGREKTNNENRIDQLGNQMGEYDNEAKKLLPKIDTQVELYKEEKNTFDILNGDYKKSQQNVDALQEKRWNEQRRLADQESLFKRTSDMLEDKQGQLNSLLSKKSLLDGDISTAKIEIDSQKNGINSLQKNVDLFQSKYKKAELDVQTLDLNKQESIRKQHSLEIKLEGLQSQVQFYENLLESKEGYPGGVKYVLENGNDFPGIEGVLSEIVEVDEPYADIIESVLGSRAGCLVATDRKTALATLKILRDGKFGNASVLPLKEISSLKSEVRNAPKNDLIIARAVDVIKTQTKFSSIIHLLLGNVLIVKDLSDALADQTLAGWDMVDTKGTYAGSNYILKQQSKSKGLVGRQTQLDSLYNTIKTTEKDRVKLQGEIETGTKKLESSIADKNGIAIELKKLNEKLNASENEVLQLTVRQDQNNELLKSIISDIDETNAAVSALELSKKKLTPSTEKAEKILSKLAVELSAANESLLAIREKRDEFHQQIQDLRIEILNLENQRDNLLFQKRAAEESKKELSGRQSTIENEIKELIQKGDELKKEIEVAEKDLQKFNAVVHKQRSILDLKREVTQDTFNEVEDVQNKINEEQRNRENLLDELKTAELDVTHYDQRINLVTERIRDRYNSKIPKQLPVDESIFEMEERIDKINRSIENIGPINMAVKDEHEAAAERLQLMEEQKADLMESEENLHETIHKIDREARKMFIETFEKIKVNFEKLFTMFFEGGKGSLSLVGDPDPLEADIAISAQPPGKKNHSLRMLSAGEKTLTAIALLFSIYQYKPSPYCILDEVDAPLDDVNIRKFTKVLSAFSDETQFIVVTHNKLTMEAADYLFGVTMEQKGVSKLVSVKFDA